MSRDVLVAGGPIWTGHRTVEAIGISAGRVVAAGSRAEVASALRRGHHEIDLEGRRAIPGLIDSHVHVMRAGLTWNDVVRWDDVTSLEAGLERIREAASARPGGGDHPVYVQLLYEEGLLNSKGLELVLADGDVPGVERDADGRPTGKVGPPAFGRVLSLFERPTLSEQKASTRALVADFLSRGVTGAIDPGGIGVTPESYEAMFDLWRSRQLDMRIRLYLVPGSRGNELEDVRNWIRYVQPGFGDELLRYVGMGEIVHFGCHDMEGVRPFEVTEEAKRELAEAVDLLAANGWPVHIHAILDSTISAVLDVFEEVDRKHGIAGRRFSLAHAEAIGRQNLERVRRLGVGLAIQNRLIYRSADSAAVWGEEVAHNAPPLGDILAMGIPLGAGTDATVVTPHDPWLAIWWLVTGESFDGAPPRAPRHRLTIEQALVAYTRGSAWFSFEEEERGHLEPGAMADVAVLTADPFEVDPAELPSIRSELTLVGGRPVHAGPAYAGL